MNAEELTELIQDSTRAEILYTNSISHTNNEWTGRYRTAMLDKKAKLNKALSDLFERIEKLEERL